MSLRRLSSELCRGELRLRSRTLPQKFNLSLPEKTSEGFPPIEIGLSTHFKAVQTLHTPPKTPNHTRLAGLLDPSTPVPLPVLCVDDDRTCLSALGFVIRRMGMEQIGALGAAHAEREFKERWNLGKPPSVLVTDFDMPETTGAELSYRLRAQGFVGPIIFFTGTPREDVLQNCHAVGVLPDAIISKPNISALVQAIKSNTSIRAILQPLG